MRRDAIETTALPASRKRRDLRALVAGPRCVSPASVFDPISSRIAGELGFPAMMLAGSVASIAVLGAPDVTAITLSELADLARRVCRASSLPLIVDADHGYGNALNVRRTVEELEQAGVAAITIEDTDLPDRFGARGVPGLVPLDEAVGKIRAALAARTDPGLMIVGRTGGAGLADIEDARRRLRAFAEAGADMVFVRGVETSEQLRDVLDGLETPAILGTSNRALADIDVLSDTTVRIVLKGHRPMMAAYHAARAEMAADREGGVGPPMLSTGDLDRLTGQATYEMYLEDYLGGAGRRENHHLG
ncbi:isocitrate lyase/PEP mutase family protein [Skermanella stibiiresistens]|uniref:isocitrate lyase/PEP mutase family protein n=1 Tax=Skermanella stibiiresistens TaxID=913326 RepID=UPI000684AFD6|nr:isocitrate lyase/PEP mutase family protein [Skermanella stibiiresistens]